MNISILDLLNKLPKRKMIAYILIAIGLVLIVLGIIGANAQKFGWVK